MDAGCTDNRLEKKYGGVVVQERQYMISDFTAGMGGGGMEIEVDFELLSCEVTDWILTPTD